MIADRREIFTGGVAAGLVVLATTAAAEEVVEGHAVLRLPTLDALRASTQARPGDLIFLDGRSAAGDGAGGFFRSAPAQNETDDDGTVIRSAARPLTFFRVFAGRLYSRWFGIPCDGRTDATASLERFCRRLDASCGEGYLDPGTYCVTEAGLKKLPLGGIGLPSDATLTWDSRAEIVMDADAVSIPHVLTGSGTQNLNLINPRVDLRGVAGNAIGFNADGGRMVDNVMVIGGRLRGTRVFPNERPGEVFQGGKGITFQWGIRGCRVIGTYFEDCDIAFSVEGWNIDADSPVQGCSFSDVHVENCPCAGYFCQNHRDDGLAYTASVLSRVSVLVNGITLHNVGRNRYRTYAFERINQAGISDPFIDQGVPRSQNFKGNWRAIPIEDGLAEFEPERHYALGERIRVTRDAPLFGGAFCWRFAIGVEIVNVRWANDDDYGLAGAFLRGSPRSLVVNNASISAALDTLLCLDANRWLGAYCRPWPGVGGENITLSLIHAPARLGRIARVLDPADGNVPNVRFLDVFLHPDNLDELFDRPTVVVAAGRGTWFARLHDCHSGGTLEGDPALMLAAGARLADAGAAKGQTLRMAPLRLVAPLHLPNVGQDGAHLVLGHRRFWVDNDGRLWNADIETSAPGRPVGRDYRAGPGAPTGSVTPAYVGEDYLDTVARRWFKATGLGVTDWQAL